VEYTMYPPVDDLASAASIADKRSSF